MELDTSVVGQSEDIENELAALQEELETEQGKFKVPKRQPEKEQMIPESSTTTTSTMEEPESTKSAAILI